MNIVIVGGGSAGWSCAAALSKNKNLSISIIEPVEFETIGVGESTLPITREFHQRFKIFEGNDWIKKVNGTLKFTLEFKNFTEKEKSKWVHPLSTNKAYEEFMLLKNIDTKTHSTITNDFFYCQRLSNNQYSNLDYEHIKIGAYHIDSNLYAKELKNISLKRGVKCISKSVKNVIQNDNKTELLILNDNSEITADLFIDCTGFKNILFQNIKSNFESFSDRLFCDSAIALKTSYKDIPKQKINATIARGLKYGWVWHVPLENKFGCGYVFSSKHTNPEDAKDEFKQYLFNEYKYEVDKSNFKYIKYRCGVHKNSWIENNIAIGLSSFFIEPLEATGIALFQIQIMELAKILETNQNFCFNYRKKYNNLIYQYINSVKDFIEMHYIKSNREDSQFWIDSSNILPNNLQKDIIDLYNKKKYTEILNYNLAGIFSNLSWIHLLLGMDSSKNI